MRADVVHGDCLDVMPRMIAETVDAIVTDPPYGLAFMGKTWDSFKAGDSPMRRTAERDAVNTGASRQGGRQRACADYQKRQARDMAAFQDWCEAWAGECLRVAKPGAHLLAFGGTRTYHRLTCAIEDAGWEIRDCLSWLYGSGFPKSHNGVWGGTALKPAWEPIIMARKPLTGTVAANHTEHGTGALNIDGCRIDAEPRKVCNYPSNGVSGSITHPGSTSHAGRDYEERIETAGRWPANVVLDEEIRLPEDAQRYFYTAKASRAERNAGLEHMPATVRRITEGHGRGKINTSKKSDGGVRENRAAQNVHPTVKPLDLMQWLCRLVTPKGGLILDPFCGSGTTGRAAVAEGFHFYGIEKEAEYVEIARARIAEYAPLFGGAA